jgi:hypothetical protein
LFGLDSSYEEDRSVVPPLKHKKAPPLDLSKLPTPPSSSEEEDFAPLQPKLPGIKHVKAPPLDLSKPPDDYDYDDSLLREDDQVPDRLIDKKDSDKGKRVKKDEGDVRRALKWANIQIDSSDSDQEQGTAFHKSRQIKGRDGGRR